MSLYSIGHACIGGEIQESRLQKEVSEKSTIPKCRGTLGVPKSVNIVHLANMLPH
jgi:hypothetical protein